MPTVAVGDLRLRVGMDDEYGRVLSQLRRRRVHVQRPEALRESHLHGWLEARLIAKEQHLVLDERLPDGCEMCFRMLEIGPADFRPEAR